MAVERDLLDYLSLGLQVLTLFATVLGLGFVVFSLQQTVRQHRIEDGPYVRVDIGLTSGIPDQKDIEVYYEDESQAVDLSAGDGGVEVSGWFRNYQSNSLGFAFGVTATFLVEIHQLQNSEPGALHLIDVEIPYLEFAKCSKVHLVSLPSSLQSSVMLSSLSFHDLYDKRHVHVYGQKGSNALHGRLYWSYIPYADGLAESESTPEGRSRGKGIDYNVGAIGG